MKESQKGVEDRSRSCRQLFRIGGGRLCCCRLLLLFLFSILVQIHNTTDKISELGLKISYPLPNDWHRSVSKVELGGTYAWET